MKEIRLQLTRLVFWVVLLLSVGGVVALFFSADRFKDYWVVVGPIIYGAVLRTLDYVAGKRRARREITVTGTGDSREMEPSRGTPTRKGGAGGLAFDPPPSRRRAPPRLCNATHARTRAANGVERCVLHFCATKKR